LSYTVASGHFRKISAR